MTYGPMTPKAGPAELLSGGAAHDDAPYAPVFADGSPGPDGDYHHDIAEAATRPRWRRSCRRSGSCRARAAT